MKKSKIETLEGILNMASTNFKVLKPDPHKKGAYVIPVRVANYSDVLFVVADILKMCMLTLEEDKPTDSSTQPRYDINVSSMLNIALQFLPFEEAEVLDELQLLLADWKE